jgi:hypothetical protein
LYTFTACWCDQKKGKLNLLDCLTKYLLQRTMNFANCLCRPSEQNNSAPNIRFYRNFKLGTFTKIWPQNPIHIKISQEIRNFKQVIVLQLQQCTSRPTSAHSSSESPCFNTSTATCFGLTGPSSGRVQLVKTIL